MINGSSLKKEKLPSADREYIDCPFSWDYPLAYTIAFRYDLHRLFCFRCHPQYFTSMPPGQSMCVHHCVYHGKTTYRMSTKSFTLETWKGIKSGCSLHKKTRNLYCISYFKYMGVQTSWVFWIYSCLYNVDVGFYGYGCLTRKTHCNGLPDENEIQIPRWYRLLPIVEDGQVRPPS